MKINVTKRNIQKGVRHQPNSCPVALAIQETFKNNGNEIVSANVSAYYIDIKKNIFKVSFSYKTPRKVATFIREFDCGMEVLPFEFEI